MAVIVSQKRNDSVVTVGPGELQANVVLDRNLPGAVTAAEDAMNSRIFDRYKFGEWEHIDAAQKDYLQTWPGNTSPVMIAGGRTGLYGYIINNTSTGWRYVKLYDSPTTVNPNVGIDPVKEVIPIPAGGGANLAPTKAFTAFASGMWVTVTTGNSPNDNTAPASGDVLMNLFYI